MQEETILYDPGAKAFCILNPTAAFVWEQLATPRTEPEISELLNDAFAVAPGSDVSADVKATIENFERLSLISMTV
jgi:hypothetical protein